MVAGAAPGSRPRPGMVALSLLDMQSKHAGKQFGPADIVVKYILEDPEGLSTDPRPEREFRASQGMNLLEIALEHGINIEHACGGVCACSTCHIYVEQGMNSLSESTEPEEDRVEEAPGLQRNSRLACQCELVGKSPVVVRVPAWNRNAVKELPH